MVTANEDGFEDRMTEEDGEEVEIVGMFDEPRKWSWVDAAFLVTALAHNLAGSVTMYLNNVSDQIYAHEEYKRQHRDFAQDVMADIKKL